MTELRTLVVSGKPETVAVYSKSKGVWVVRGACGGSPIRVEDRSEDAALERWRAAAGKAAGNKGKSRRRKS